MPCFAPLKGYRAQTVNPSGKRSIVFSKRDGYLDLPIELPCGQCIGCRLERSRQWAIRCVHEASLHEDNSFITLTYAPENLPPYNSLQKAHFQNFFKSLRHHFSLLLIKSHPLKGIPLLPSHSRPSYSRRFYRPIRYFHCGEYGEKKLRPHYHACVFGIDFADKTKVGENENGDAIYDSATLKKLWGYGIVRLGAVTFESAAYVARYITKKITGPKAGEHYQDMDPVTGEFVAIQPEYVTMSRRPGIGKGWYEKWSSDVYPSDFIVMREKLMSPPKFYKSQYELADPSGAARLKARHQNAAKKNAWNNTVDRLIVREAVKISQFKKLKRKYENEST